MRIVLAVGVLLALFPLTGCVAGRCCPPGRSAAPRPEAPPAPTGEPAAGPRSVVRRGEDGRVTALADEAATWGDVDLIAFGELHGHPVGAQAELDLLKALAVQERPVALAMEFLERDTQPAVDAYLAGEIDLATLKQRARQGRAFDGTHGPLLAYAKAHDIPVIAANAPRRLVRAYRKQDASYETWREGLPAEDQAWLPRETTVLEDEYRDRFVKLMGEERGASFFRSQSLWDDAMAEAVYDFRSEHPAHRVLLVVGGFHVRGGLGTITKYRLRRAKDDVRVVLMTMDADPALPFDEEDLGAADVLIEVPRPAPKPVKGPNPHARPKPGAKHPTP